MREFEGGLQISYFATIRDRAKVVAATQFNGGDADQAVLLMSVVARQDQGGRTAAVLLVLNNTLIQSY